MNGVRFPRLAAARTLVPVGCLLIVSGAVGLTPGPAVGAAPSTSATAASVRPALAAPVDPAATSAAAQLLANLQARAGQAKHRVALGQEIQPFGPSPKNTGWYRDFYRLRQRGLRLPMIVGAEADAFSDGAEGVIVRQLIKHANAGGMVELDWHPNDPVDGSYPGTPATVDQLDAMAGTDTTSPLYQAWHGELDKVAATLQEFAAAGVPVMFRPLVEMNGQNFFWWADDGSTGAAHAARVQAFVAIWRDLVHYLTVVKGLHNLLFLYAPAAPGYGGVTPVMDYYPGAQYVDLVGVDVYDNDLVLSHDPVDPGGVGSYHALVATGKPFGFAEFGQGLNNAGTGTGSEGKHWDARTLAQRVRQVYPATAFATAWYSSFGSNAAHTFIYGLSDVAHVAGLIKDPLIQTLPNSAP